jgi:hypothetical protein
VNGETADPSDRVAAGDVIELEVPEAYAANAEPEDIPLEVVYEDEDLLVVNKATTPARWCTRCSVAAEAGRLPAARHVPASCIALTRARQG